MRTSWKALAFIGLVGTVGAVGLVSSAQATNATNPAQVIVTNPSNAPVPVTGTLNVGNFPNFPTTQAVSGSVSVSNFPSFPSTQAVSGTVNVQGSISPAAPAHPVLLRGAMPANPGGSTTVTLFDDESGAQTLTRKLAIGSITVSTEGGGSSATVYVILRATDCGQNGLGGVENLTVHGDSTTQLTYPVPEVIPVVGNGSYCVVADILNGDQLAGGVLDVRVVGYGVS